MATYLLPIGAIVPLVMASLLSWLWWSALSKPWLYFAIAVGALYVVFGAIVVWILSNIGIARATQRSPLADSADQMVLMFLVAGILVGVLLLWALKVALSK